MLLFSAGEQKQSVPFERIETMTKRLVSVEVLLVAGTSAFTHQSAAAQLRKADRDRGLGWTGI